VTPADILKAIAATFPRWAVATAGAQQREDGNWLIDGHPSRSQRVCRAAICRVARTTTPWPASCSGTWAACRCPAKARWRDQSIEVVDMDGLVIDKLLVQRAAQGLRSGEPART
jgi:hypothetical protein